MCNASVSAMAEPISSEEQRAYIKIESLRGKSASDIHSALKEVCGSHCLHFSNIFRWMQRFKQGEISIQDEPRSGRPAAAMDDYYVDKVKECVDKDRRMTCEEIASEVGVSHSSVYRILTERLGMKKISARWVPHCLTKEQIEDRLRVAQNLLERYEKEGESFISRIVAIDETWLRSYEPELKRQSTEWHTPASPRPAKFIRKQGNLKLMMICAYDSSGVLLMHRVKPGQTVNGDYYRTFLQRHLRHAIRKKRPDLLQRSPIILHDNAAAHKCNVVTELLTSYKWHVLEHPPYSPDMSPPDYDLFPKLKENLRGIRFENLEELESAAAAQVRHINNCCLATGVARLPTRWRAVIQKKGHYFEGM